METFKGTIRQLAELFEVEYADAQGFIKFLSATGRAKKVGVQPAPGGKGKGSDVWEIQKKLEIAIP